jgi:hypothetical protein
MERLARVMTVEMGGSAQVSLYPSTGKDLKQYGIQNIVTLSEKIGRIINQRSADLKESLAELLIAIDGKQLFEGKIVDILRTTEKGFNFGQVKLEGLNEDQHSEMVIHFQNENLLAEKDGQYVTMTPDLISIVDMETLVPVTTEALKYGKRVRIIASPSDDKWRTDFGIETVGPRYFGYDVDYRPLEEL